jgi:tetratricopeptide (TPR) repeat protein
MKRFVDRLEGGYRAVRIRRIRRVVNTILALITIFFAAAVMVANDGSLKPFYLPLDIVIAVVLVMCLVWLILSFAFRNLRIKYTQRSSQKFLMAGNSMRRSLVLIVIVTFIGVLFAFPPFLLAMEDQLSGEMSVAVDERREINFWNMDSLGLTRTGEMTLTSNSDLTACFMEGDFVNGTACPPGGLRLVTENSNETFELNADGFQMYSLVLNSSGYPTVTITTKTTISETILGIVPLTMFLMAALSVAWIAFLYPVRQKLAEVSIYSEDYVERVSKDERFYGGAPVKRRPAVGTAPKPTVDADKGVAAEPTAQVTPEKDVERPPPPPPEEEIPPPPELVDVPYLFEQAKDRVAARDFEQAVGFYNDILEREPDSIAALIGKGTALTSLDREDETIECMNEVLKADPSNKAALLWMAKVFDSRENWDEALKWYDRYLGIYHGDEKQWIKHGDVLANLGRGDIAIESYRNALKINPNNQEAARRLEKLKVSVKDIMTQALSRSALGDHVGALELFDRVLRIDPGNVKALLGKGVAYRRLNKINGAIECLNRVLEMEPENQAALLNKGALLEGQERWEEALYCYNKLLEISPKDEEAWVKKGDVLLNLGMKQEAHKSYGEVLALNPDNQDVEQRRLAVEGELEEAIDEEAVEEMTRIRGITMKRATLLYEAGFRSVDDLRGASTNNLKAIKGISRKTARMILESVRAEAEEFGKRLNEIPGVGPSLATAITEAGYSSVHQITSATPEKLSEIKGISKKKAENIIDFLSQ